MGELEGRQQRAVAAQGFDDHVVGLPDVQASQHDVAERRRGRQVHATTIDRVDLRGAVAVQQAVLLGDLVVLLAVAGCRMHGAGAVFGRNVVAQQQRDVALGIERMRQQQAFQRLAGHAAVHHRLAGHAIARERLADQRIGQHQPARLAVVGRAFDQRVLEIRADAHRQRRRQRPRGGGPDRHRDLDAFRQLHAEARGQRLRIARGIGHVHRRRFLVGVFDLRLGQRRAAVEAPVHRLHAAAQVAVVDDLRQRADLVGFEVEVQRLVRVVPIADHAQALEVAALQVDLLARVLAALLPEFDRVQLHADLAELLLDGDLDRQAVAIPARDVRCVEARQVLGLDDDVLEDLVDRMAQVDLAIGVRRAVMQHEGRAAGGMRAQLGVQALVLPARQDPRLALGQVAAHREFRRRQLEGGFVVLAHAVARSRCSERMRRACSASRCICAVSAGRPSNFSSSRSLATNSTSMWRP